MIRAGRHVQNRIETGCSEIRKLNPVPSEVLGNLSQFSFHSIYFKSEHFV